MPSESENTDAYRTLGRFYNLIAWLYSGGAIGRSKRTQSEALEGRSVCYVGVGNGEDALAASQAGAKVTVVDRSDAMLNQLKRRFEKANRALPRIIRTDIKTWQSTEQFDVLITNYFLNQYAEEDLKGLLPKLKSMITSDGQWMIADFHLWGRNPLKKFYWYVPLIPAHFTTGETIHPFVDYIPLLEAQGMKLQSVTHERLAHIGPAWFRNLTFKARGTGFN